MNLFAYGTLIWSEILADVIGRNIKGCPARLSGARRLRVKDQVYPSLVPTENGEVDGVLYFDLTEPEIESLDRFEGDEYTRRSVEVRADGRSFSAEVYFASEQGLSLLQSEEWNPDQLCPIGVQTFRRSYKGWS